MIQYKPVQAGNIVCASLPKIKPEADFLFEVSWEVCNKVGGIWTVLTSKANKVKEYYGDRYYLIGPYFPENLKGDFEEISPGRFKNVFQKLEGHGIRCHLGRWLIEGEPQVILIDFKDFWVQADEIKKQLWEDYKINSLNADHSFSEPVIWSWATGKLIEEIAKQFKDKKIVAQFHEWIAGAGLLYLKKQINSLKNIATVFTTHATTVGRTLVYNGVDFYSDLNNIDAEKQALKYNIEAKHQMEKATAQNSDILTTVSEITALEVNQFLGRKTDELLFNGLDLKRFPSIDQAGIKHHVQKTRLREFIISYFFPYYSFNIEETLFYFITGRYEFKAKGIDVYIKALAELNKKLKKKKSEKTIVAFIWIPAGVTNIKTELIENKEFFQDIKQTIDDSWGIREKILYLICEGREISKQDLFEKKTLNDLKKKILKFRRKGLPPVSTHDLDSNGDVILRALKENKLNNEEQDRVKVIYYPIYLTGHDGLSNLSYEEAILASHLGVFPSSYEPWGYTPLETAALRISSVTTDLAGFGRYCQSLSGGKKEKYPGIFILERFAKTKKQEVSDLTDIFYKFSQFTHQERVENKIEARKKANFADWEHLIENYIRAHNRAIKLLPKA